MTATLPTRTIDNRGRLSLGTAFANTLVIVRELPDGVLEIVPAEAVPAREVWLYKNAEAHASVMQGLKQAKAKQFVEPPEIVDV